MLGALYLALFSSCAGFLTELCVLGTLSVCSVCKFSLNEGGLGGGQSDPELGRSSLDPDENQDSRHDSQLEYCTVLALFLSHLFTMNRFRYHYFSAE